MSVLDGSRGALPAVAHHAAELGQPVRDRRMRAIWLDAHIHQRCFLRCHVASHATIDYTQFRYPYLLDAGLEPPFERGAIAMMANQPQVSCLIARPLPEDMLHR